VGLGGSYGLEEGTARIGADAPWITRRRLLQGLVSGGCRAAVASAGELGAREERLATGEADLAVLLQFASFCCPAAKAGQCLNSDQIVRWRLFHPTAGDPGAGKSDPPGDAQQFPILYTIV
jgi:hypothetical protein